MFLTDENRYGKTSECIAYLRLLTCITLVCGSPRLILQSASAPSFTRLLFNFRFPRVIGLSGSTAVEVRSGFLTRLSILGIVGLLQTVVRKAGFDVVLVSITHETPFCTLTDVRYSALIIFHKLGLRRLSLRFRKSLLNRLFRQLSNVMRMLLRGG